MTTTRLVLLAASLAALALVLVSCGGGHYPRAVSEIRSSAAWVDARVAGAYVCEAERELARLEAIDGTVGDFEAWEQREWGAVLDASEVLNASLNTVLAFHDAGEPDQSAAEAAAAMLRIVQALEELVAALDSAEVPLPLWVTKGLSP